MVEAVGWRPTGKRCLALLGEEFLEAVVVATGEGGAGGDGAAGAGIAPLKINFADFEADDVAFIGGEELIFPERRQGFAVGGGGGIDVDFEGSAEAQADLFQGHPGQPFGAQGKPIADGLQAGSGDDGGAVGDGVVWKAFGRVTDNDLLIEEHAEPFGGVFVSGGEGESTRGNVARVVGDGEGDGSQVWSIVGADQVNGGSAFGVDPFAIDGIESPGAIMGQAASRPDMCLRDRNGVKRFDGVDADLHEMRSDGHTKSLADERRGGSREMRSVAGSGGQGATALMAGVGRFGGMVMERDGLRGREERNGLDVGHGATAGEGDADVGGSYGVREFGDGQDVKAAGGEEGSAELTAEVFDGSADGFKTIFGIF